MENEMVAAARERVVHESPVHGPILLAELDRVRGLLTRYLILVMDEEGWDYFDGDWKNSFTPEEVVELRAITKAAR